MTSWLDGPVPRPREERLAVAREIAERARTRFDAVAVGFYGSLARNADGPYSDIEIHCVASTAPDEDIEWLHDGWAVDVNVRSRASMLRHATEVPGNWAISHANYLYVSPVHDPEGFFDELKAAMRAVPEERFTRAIADVLGHLYGATSKLRNARHWGIPPPPGFMHYLAALGCNMIGLANRHAYSTATAALTESLRLRDRFASHDALCRRLIADDATDDETMFALCERYWAEAAAWAQNRGSELGAKAHRL